MHIGKSLLLSVLALGTPIGAALAQTTTTTTTTTPTKPVLFLDAVNISATREEKSLKDTPASVTVIDRQEMDTYMFNDMESMVRYTPGVTVGIGYGADPFKQQNGFNIRGVGGNRILTLVDGNRVAERITDGTRNFVDLAFMKSVEIVKGPNSVLWGSDAMGGTVAYETLDPSDILTPGQDWGFQGSVRYGSLDRSWNETITGAYRLGQVEFLLGYSRWDAQQVHLTKGREEGGIWGDCQRPGDLPCSKFDPMDRGSNNVLAKVVWSNDTHEVGLTGEYYDQSTAVDQWSARYAVSAGWLTNQYEQEQDLTRWRVSLEHEWQADFLLFDSIDWQVSYHPQSVDIYGIRRREGVSGAVVGQESTVERWRDYNEDFIDFDVQLDKAFTPFDGVTTKLVYGLDGSYTMAEYDSVDRTANQTTGVSTTTSASSFTNSDTLRLDGYLQAEFGFFDDRLIITPGVRYTSTQIKPKAQDWYVSSTGDPDDVNWNDWLFAAAALFKVTEEVSVYASYGEGFKTPTASQLYTSSIGTSFDMVANPDLQPESVRSYEIGARADFGWGAFSLTGFHSSYDNFIVGFQFIDGPDPTKLYITSLNLSSLKVWGIEASAEVETFDNVFLKTSLSWSKADQIAEDGADETAFNNAQPFMAVNGIRYENPELGLGVELIHTFEAGLKRVTSKADLTTENYHVFDVVASYQPEPWITLRAGVFNIFDQRYLSSAAVAAYSTPAMPATNVANGNPIELRVAPGINFSLQLSIKF